MKAAYCTLGCKVNQYDTQAMRELMENAGYDTVDFEVECMGVSEKPVGQGTCDEQTRLCGIDERAVRVRVLMAMEGIK